MKYLLVIFIWLYSVSIISAQEGLPFYEHYLLSDRYLLNPSYAGSDINYLKVNATHTSQWTNLENVPSTQTISAHTRITDRLGSGLYVLNDKNGATSLLGFNLALSYHIPMGEGFSINTYEEDNQFSFGLAFNGINQVFDRTLWNYQHPNDPLLIDDNYFMSYLSVGGSFFFDGIYGGFSVVDVPLGDNFVVTNAIEPIPIRYYLNGGYKFFLNQSVELDPSALVTVNGRGERMIDLSINSNLESGYNKFGVGLNFRSQSYGSETQMLSLAPMVKLEIGQLKIGYLYRFGLSDVYKENGNGHMFSLGYNFRNPFQ